MPGTVCNFVKKATSLGVYWTSCNTKSQLQDYLSKQALTFFKKADTGEQEQGFEQAFASLGYSYLKDKAPRLLDFIVGFQLIDRNEDNTKAAGVFGFKVGDQWLYAPIFFLNGDLKGHELLYVKKQDAFVPMKENWVNYLISRKPHVLGEGSNENTHQLGGLMPNLMRMARPPIGTKYGIDIQEWAVPFMPLVSSMMLKQAKFLYPNKSNYNLNYANLVQYPFKAALAPLASSFDMRNCLTTFPLLKSAFEKCYLRYPLVKAGFDRFYGKDFFKSMAEMQKIAMDSLLYKEAWKPKKPYKKKLKKKSFDSLIPQLEEESVNSNLNIIILDPITKQAKTLEVNEDVEGTITNLTDKEREKLLSDTVLIKDKRDPHSTSMAYNTQTKLDLSNPDMTGLYEVLEKPGKFSEMLVLVNPHTGRGAENFCTAIRKSDPRAWKNSDRNILYVKQNRQPTQTKYEDYVKDLESVTSLKKGGTYIALDERGGCTAPFTVREDYGDGNYRVDWDDCIPWSERSWRRTKDWEDYTDYDAHYSSWDAKVWINKRKGSKLRAFNGELSIPDEFKILKLKDPPRVSKKDNGLFGMMEPESINKGESKEAPIMPGNISDVQLLLNKEASNIKLLDTGGSEIWLKYKGINTRLTKSAALISLIKDHGLNEKQAREMIKEAALLHVRNKPAVFFIKYARGYPLQPGPSAPNIPEPMRGSEMNGYNSVQSIYPQEEFMPVDQMSSYNTDPSVYDPFYTPDQGAMQVAQQASQSGQKEIFDTSTLASLLKSNRQDTIIDKHLGSLMEALSNLGKILMSFFYHQEEFEDRYGKDDLGELEDSLRNAFFSLGEVVLYLRERSVESEYSDSLKGSVGKSDSEPSISETARSQ